MREALSHEKDDIFVLIHLVHRTVALSQVEIADEAGFWPLFKVLIASLENQLRRPTQGFIFSVL